ncbi:UDP-glucose 4-epimerase [Rhodococcus sp. 06-462-5]|uniref:NAD-dependent epimerase/dehydratase family protein n=1 Tax=unclassified Rhodococcus (in: high G+C Gram-positive bacteria) TaxID=192944 RepID=UPI000B9A40DC|nr:MULTISPECIES: NAD-dependent epimerase/dehydratase family protein [unclassified Rhodococcus (in: high G+C Gram-positive bacteria)]OZC75186.1 UDP-glucose 4-epimerase [Rhodococcus sp. 06-462-5]OZE67703.1 UDP-glucose 4-epimerase [Rhodococcus sp. 02-925g]
MTSRVLVTGAAGFVGSTISDSLLQEGYEVLGVDSMNDYYDPAMKEDRLKKLSGRERFTFIRGDLLDLPLKEIIESASFVVHQAGQPGVRNSWSSGFDEYVSRNVILTQRLLEASKEFSIERFVYASSSSLYGNQEHWPCSEAATPQPFSPYGVTKLAAEHLVSLYAENFGLHTASLRYFTVYGPGQRPDMAFHRFCEATISGNPVKIFGDGGQRRDFTYVDDIVRANILAMTHSNVGKGSIYNVCGGTDATVNDVLETLERIAGSPVPVERVPAVSGDVRRTAGDSKKIRDELDWSPKTSLHDGLSAQLAWHKGRDR